MTAERAFRRLRRAVEARILDEACSHERAASGRHFLGDVAKLSLVMVVVHVLVDNPAHEVGHWLVGLLLGVHWDAARDAFVSTLGATGAPSAVAIVYLAGGVVSGTVLSVLALLAPPPWRGGILPLAAAEFAYAPFDATGLGDAVGLIAFVAVTAWILSVHARHYLAAAEEPIVTEDPAAEAVRRTRFVECLAAFRFDMDGGGRTPTSGRPQRARKLARCATARPKHLSRTAFDLDGEPRGAESIPNEG